MNYKYVSQTDYNNDICYLYNELRDKKYDCIVSLKRSGWILGACLSNKLEIPLYSDGEISNIPYKFNKVLLLDDKVYTGASIRKVKNKLLNKYNKSVTTATLYIEADYLTDIWIIKVGKKVLPYYEDKNFIQFP
jgi:hypoxanthine phosphoribosyltransferase